MLDTDIKIRRQFHCPICHHRRISYLGENLAKNLDAAFPYTFGAGLCICDDCLPARLEQMKKL